VHLSATHRDPPTPGTGRSSSHLSAESILDEWMSADDLAAVCPAACNDNDNDNDNDDNEACDAASWDEIERTVQTLATATD
jgi:hypothetical protein